MALVEKSMFFDSVGDDDRDYTSSMFATPFRRMFTNGIFRATNPLAVSADGVSMNLGITAGGAHINGRFYELENDGTITAPTSPTNLYYYAVLRLNLSTDARNITVQLKPGTASTLPALQRNESIWELALASFRVTGGRTYISPGDVTDLRGDNDLCGYVRNTGDPAYYPASDIPQLLWTYALFPNTLTTAQKQEVQNNPSLMAIFNNMRAFPSDWSLLTSYTSAGTFTWKATDVYGDGQPYGIGVYIIGGGGGGGAVRNYSSTGSYQAGASGGGSGCTRVLMMTVTPNTNYTVVVGAGGNAATFTTANAAQPGGNGGASSFNGNTALGGDGGKAAIATGQIPGARGGQGSTVVETMTSTPTADAAYSAVAPAMGEVPRAARDTSNYLVLAGLTTPTMCFNPFNNKRYLGAGGGANAQTYNSTIYDYAQAVPTLDDGLSAGAGVTSASASAITGNSATSPGSGGGAVAAKTNSSASIQVASGKGAAGAVFIYARRAV